MKNVNNLKKYIDMNEFAFDIIIVAGQSNAEGNGLKNNKNQIISDNVYHLIDKNNVATKVCDDGKVILDMVYPTEMILEVAHERVQDGNLMADFSQTFAQKYIEDGRLKNGRKILIVKAAVGGTGFARKEWGVGSILLKRLMDMVDYALSLNKDNKIVALLWHQGEHDCVENVGLSIDELYNFYFNNLLNQFNLIRTKYSQQIPIVTGEFVNSWADLPENKEKCDVVETAMKNVCNNIKYSMVVSSSGLLSNDQVFYNGDNIHFCGESIYELGKRYYSAYKSMLY